MVNYNAYLLLAKGLSFFEFLTNLGKLTVKLEGKKQAISKE
ncbi:hypothetical protein COO91_04109 [Nostoc flagelliforme CCNUN1]|uniref:Uncharacterized protein n=1 Tax=Nostoc flagelliforme CCNUN1 TaxID=2038116 RepID=A0A2K8SRN9_9NOSO|nr:hypothetical protein COO91_04109 [Nostoc flagelliforme CCNUN1]